MQKLWQVLENPKLFKYGVAAILLVVPLYPKFPIFNVPGTYVAIRAEDFLLSGLGLAWVLYMLRHFSRKFFNVKIFDLEDKFVRSVILFFAVGLLSVVSAVWLTHTASLHLALFHWARRIEYLLPFFIAMSAVKLGARPRFFAETLAIASFVAVVYGVGQIYLHWPVISTQNFEYAKGIALRWIPGARVHSTFAGHYDLAAFLVLVFPVMIAYLFALKKNFEKAILLFAVIVPSFWLFLQTESRVSFFSFLIGVTATLWVIKKRLFIAPFLILSILGMFALSDLGARYIYTIRIYSVNFQFPPRALAQEEQPKAVSVSPAPSEDRSVSIRLNIEWPRALRAFSKNPLLGTGYSSISLATDNDYLRLIGEVGLVGALAFFLVLVRLIEGFGKFFRRLNNIGDNAAFVGGFFGSFLGLLVNATFIDVFEASKVAIIFWTMAGIAVGLAKGAGTNE